MSYGTFALIEFVLFIATYYVYKIYAEKIETGLQEHAEKLSDSLYLIVIAVAALLLSTSIFYTITFYDLQEKLAAALVAVLNGYVFMKIYLAATALSTIVDAYNSDDHFAKNIFFTALVDKKKDKIKITLTSAAGDSLELEY